MMPVSVPISDTVLSDSVHSVQLRAMVEADVEAVLEIEREVHAHPWTHGNFVDALRSGYECWVLENQGELLGYVVLMKLVDEAELLTLGVATAYQRRGLGRILMRAMLDWAHGQGMRRVFLEVRRSNLAAIALYRSQGFRDIGLRRGYYPTAPARGMPVATQLRSRDPSADNGREDALLMECHCE